jgi:hypothetical protein
MRVKIQTEYDLTQKVLVHGMKSEYTIVGISIVIKNGIPVIFYELNNDIDKKSLFNFEIREEEVMYARTTLA